ncbi:MAG TPA: methyltransferase domain-containing protein [Verrucomicrobiae bacterium]|jgi:SAM-dependent methyltransferase|nr:methyltransferase domain-containing protein [Verrucomicrobiae bacterium]
MNEASQPNEEDSFRTQFWVKRWERGKQPWDLGHVPPNLAEFLTRTSFAPAPVLIPGCGTGYEVRAFHEAGYDVEAIDFSGPAVAHAREMLGPLGNRVIQGNFFKHDFGEKRYSLIYERGFLCSFAPEHWEAYVSRISGLLLPGGRLVGLFLYGDEPEPPPFPLTDQTAAALFGRSFRLVTVEAAAPDSVPVYQGKERWQEWEKTK